MTTASFSRPVFLLLLLFLVVAFVAPAAAIPARSEMPLVRKGLDRMARMEYAAADSTLAALPFDSPARPFFSGIAQMNRFVDLGDTAALRRAEDLWETLSPRGEASPRFRAAPPATLALYRGLAGMQLSYAASLRGHRVRATTLAFAARGHLEDLTKGDAGDAPPEARATLMLYHYYRGRLLEKVPFVGEAPFDVKAFVRAADASPALRDILLGSLFWIHVDQGRFAAAEGIVAEFLGRHPENRLARQMRAVARYRAGRMDEARADFEALTAEYAAEHAARPRAAGMLPLGYYRCVGNLARLHAARGDRRATDEALAEWRRAEAAGLMPWLPPALKRDLARL